MANRVRRPHDSVFIRFLVASSAFLLFTWNDQEWMHVAYKRRGKEGRKEQSYTSSQKSVDRSTPIAPHIPSSSFFRPWHFKPLDSRQAHKDRQHLRVIRGPESRHRVPPAHGSEARSSAALVPTRGDIV